MLYPLSYEGNMGTSPSRPDCDFFSEPLREGLGPSLPHPRCHPPFKHAPSSPEMTRRSIVNWSEIQARVGDGVDASGPRQGIPSSLRAHWVRRFSPSLETILGAVALDDLMAGRTSLG